MRPSPLPSSQTSTPKTLFSPRTTTARRLRQKFVKSENTRFCTNYIPSKYAGRRVDAAITRVRRAVRPIARSYEFQAKRKVPRLGTPFACRYMLWNFY